MSEFGFDAHAELMTAIARKAQAFTVIADDFDCHLMWLVESKQQKGPSDKDEPVADGWFVLESAKTSVHMKLEAGLLRFGYRLRVVSLIVSSTTVAATASKALASAFMGNDMVFHLLFEENCGVHERNPRLM